MDEVASAQLDVGEGRTGDARLRAPCGAAAAERWYVVQSIRGREALAKQNLQRQGVRVFLPLFSRPVVRRHIVTPRIAAFFPGYLFVNMTPSSPMWRSVGGTLGVSRIVRFGDAPAPVPEGLVEHLIQRIAPSGVLGFDDDLRPGDRVRVVGGAFDTVFGVLCSLEASDRVVVLMELMGRKVPVQVPRSSIMACASAV
jgi:transcription elongation factor/antiterminator RfaH